MKYMFLTCWAFIASTVTSFAQNEENSIQVNDTLVVLLENQNQVRIIGPSMLDIIAYTKADSLKELFVNDLKKVIVQTENKQLPKTVWYIVSANGKRRLKMKTDEYADESFDLKKETYRLQQDLPAHELTIYDLRTGIIIQFYVANEKGLDLIYNTSLQSAINFALANKKEAKQVYRYDIKPQLDGFTMVHKQRNHLGSLELSPNVGANLIGNVFTPVIGADIAIHYFDKHSIEVFRTGLRMNGYFFSDFTGGKFNKIYANTGYDLFFALNMNTRSRTPYFFGIEAGFLSNTDGFDRVFKGNPLHFGLNIAYKGFEYSFGGIYIDKNQRIPMVGVKLPF